MIETYIHKEISLAEIYEIQISQWHQIRNYCKKMLRKHKQPNQEYQAGVKNTCREILKMMEIEC